MLEVLVVLAITAVLVALLLPALRIVREHAKLVDCESNLRQLGIALQSYAGLNRNRYPPSLSFPSPGQFWYDKERLGLHLSFSTPAGLARTGGPIFSCRNDDRGQMSYSMNIWASSAVDPAVAAAIPDKGTLWAANVKNGSQMILMTETWSAFGSTNLGYFAPATVGFRGPTSGCRFGGDAGIVPPFSAGRWGPVNCELAFLRHRKSGSAGRGTQPRGRINIAYADGHVATRTDADLVDHVTGASTGDSKWSPSF